MENIKNLVIVESPAKSKTIEGFLGKDYHVTSCFGHIRDLEKKNSGIDINNKFKPKYIVPDEKKSVVKELKKLAGKSETIWLATDEDREGEAISWHIKDELEIPESKIKRIVFNEITKKAILKAIENPRKIDIDLVEAQQARRILDRLVGFELSPILWRKIKSKLSAGRVQSVAVRLIVEREREIDAFVPFPQFRVVGNFIVEEQSGRKSVLKAELSKKFATEKEAKDFLSICQESKFNVDSLEKKLATKTSPAPFTTSTLQQEASRKLGFSVSKTMLVAQKLYESGQITYMRTDSTNLSDFAIQTAKETIVNNYGKEYSNPQQYKTKSQTAQEAHEAIRPTYFENATAEGTKDEKSLYQLIWKRAIASQMSDAKLERTTVKLAVSKSDLFFIAKGEVIIFDGFLKVYLESHDEDNGNGDEESELIPPLKDGQELFYEEITATQRYTRPPARYTEASLVKKLEELGIGRPSTYAPTISTIQKRGYVHKDERQGKEREYKVIFLHNNLIKEEIKTEITGADKGKLIPADIAMLVNDFLLNYFPNILDFQFTAKVEEELDEVAEGKIDWHKMLAEFYFPFHKQVEHTLEKSERVSGERILGKDPVSGKQVSVRMARFGPVAVISDPDDEETKPKYAGLRNTQKLESISFEEAMELFKMPRELGLYEDYDVIISIGRFGPYVRHDSKFYSIPKDLDPYSISFDEAIDLIEKGKIKEKEKTVKTFAEDPKLKILNGRFGAYIKSGMKNIRIPKGTKIDDISYEECMKIVEEYSPTKKKPRKKS
ncbi:MAG: type I DNA topoisomerase [Ignavibacteriales bacterium CG_4_9_14_3_um_filter_34_10]|nr:MAG: type I DNA topoisomerase [Ignavibacteriales bacterium CG_4_9_14_3_um_filter_34_10]